MADASSLSQHGLILWQLLLLCSAAMWKANAWLLPDEVIE